MNNTISVYELLGLIKDGKAPKKIKYENIIWKYNLEENEYIEDRKDYRRFQDYFSNNLNFLDCLNDKVEILEEDKPIIEKLNLDREPLKGEEVPRAIDYLLEGRINEVIEFLNRKEDKNN